MIKPFIFKFINDRIYSFGLRMVKKEYLEEIDKNIKLMQWDLEYNTRKKKEEGENSAECIIFSMNRAFQLHALLGSYYENVKHPVLVNIVYRASNEEHKTAYDEVFSIFKDKEINISQQKNKQDFKPTVLNLLKNMKTHRVFFLVDDIIFIDNLDLEDFLKLDTRSTVPSLRLGLNIKKSYMVQKNQELPKFINNSEGRNNNHYWIWKEGTYDWAYPLSVDGNLFDRQEILKIAENVDFDSPNSFEAGLQSYNHLFEFRYGICYNHSKILNIPCNRVQQEIDNRNGEIHQDELLGLWNKGLSLIIKNIMDLTMRVFIRMLN